MKIIKKTYFLVGILIAAAGVNLLLLYQAQQESTDESFTIIRAGDLKVKVETIASLASSIAAGNEGDRNSLQREIVEFDLFLRNLRTGGTIQGQSVAALPDNIIPNYDQDISDFTDGCPVEPPRSCPH